MLVNSEAKNSVRKEASHDCEVKIVCWKIRSLSKKGLCLSEVYVGKFRIKYFIDFRDGFIDVPSVVSFVTFL